MPYPNFHACRVRDPKDFEENSFRSITLKGTRGIRVIIGRLKGKTTTTAQAYRFPKTAYSVDQARAWCKDNNVKCIEFEPASKRKGDEIVNAPAIAMYDLKKVMEEEGGSFELAYILSKFFPDQTVACEPCREESGSEEGSTEEGEEVEFTSDPEDDEDGDEQVENEEPAQYENVVPIVKINAKKRIVYGVVYAPEEPDAHNHYMTAETIEEAAHRFLSISRKVDEMHDYIKGAGIPVESFIVREGDKDFVHEDGPQKGKAKVGAWVVATKVLSDEVWKRVLKGEIKAYSLAGMASLGKKKELDSRWVDPDGNRQDPYGDDKPDKK